MSLKDAFIGFEQNHDTNQLIAAARAAGVSVDVSDKGILLAAEQAAEGVHDGNGGRKPVRTSPELLEQRAEQFVAAVGK
jgi:hypothetical protein